MALHSHFVQRPDAQGTTTLLLLTGSPLSLAASTSVLTFASSTAFTASFGYFSTASTSNLYLSGTNNALLVTNDQGQASGTTTLSVSFGGTGSTTLGGILKGNGTGYIQSAIAGTDYLTGSGAASNCVMWGPGNTLADALSPCNTGVSSGGGTWATTTSQVSGQLINYPGSFTDIVTVGASATSSAKFIFDPNLQYMTVRGSGFMGGSLTLSSIFSTTTSQFAGGFLSQASSTIGDGTQTGGLTINGSPSMAARLIRLQTDFIQAQMQAMTEQAKDLSETATKALMDAAKTPTKGGLSS